MAKRKTAKRAKKKPTRRAQFKKKSKAEAAREYMQGMDREQLRSMSCADLAAELPVKMALTSISTYRRQVLSSPSSNGDAGDLEMAENTLVSVSKFARKMGGLEVLKRHITTLERLQNVT